MASGACKLAIRLLYEAAVGTDKGFVSDVLTQGKLPSRDKYEQAAYAYACMYYRAGNVDKGVWLPTSETKGPIEPLSDEQIAKACHDLVTTEATRSVLVRFVTFSLCIRASAKFCWSNLQITSDEAARGRLVRYLSKFSETCTYNTYGDNYVENRLRLILPAWSLVSTPRGLCPYRVVDELIHDDANDVVRGILDPQIRTCLKNYNDDSDRFKALCAAVCTLQEASGGSPKLLINENINRYADPNEPNIALLYNFPDDVKLGIVTGTICEWSSRWDMPVLDCLVEAIIAARDLGISGMADIAAAIIDNDTTSPAFVYVQ